MAVRYNKLWKILIDKKMKEKRLARSGAHYALSDDEACTR